MNTEKRNEESFGARSSDDGTASSKESPDAIGDSIRAPMSPREARRRSSLKGLRILIVDNNPLSRSIIRHFLEGHGCVSRGVGDGDEALRALRSESYEVVIMDVEMPRLEGLGVTQEIRSPDSMVLDPRVPIIGLSTLPEKEGKERCVAAGMDDYLTKPIDPRIIYNAIMKQIMKREGE